MSQPKKHLIANAPFDLYLGVDSVLNYNGVHEGALDPINGMYWTWQTGYINCKLEGNIICDSSRKSFEYHIGGYSTNDSGPFFIGHKSIGNELQVTLDIYPAIQWAMKKEVFRIMSPGKLSDQMAQAILTDGISEDVNEDEEISHLLRLALKHLVFQIRFVKSRENPSSFSSA